MANDPLAMERMRELLTRREPLYAQCDLHVDTSGRGVRETVAAIVKALKHA
jgi:XRE family aerobic/anaerobic benzoate catabolism transcriptional regulator